MDMTLVSSKHAKTVFVESKFQVKDQAGNVVNNVQLDKPVEVLFEGVDLDTYKFISPEEYPSTDLTKELDSINEKFAFLFVGHWLQGALGEDRKNVGLLISSFLHTFKNKPIKPALVLKTSSATNCIMDREEILFKIDSIRKTIDSEDLPNIYLLHGDLDDSDINLLYNHPKIKAMVSLTKGEGFGRPLLEFTLSKKIVAASDWSGHKDFLNPEHTYLIPGRITQVHSSAVVPNMILAESGWFTPDELSISKMWNELYTNYKKYEVPGKKQGHLTKTEFTFDKMTELLGKIIEERFDKPKILKLPELKKIELPKLNKI
jgi:hypothetical protein